MKQQHKNLGKVRPTVEGDWSINKEYALLSIVWDEVGNGSYISRQDVPIGIQITNKQYWTKFSNTRIDSDSIVLLSKVKDNGVINAYTLKEAIDSFSVKDRRLGMFISFYEKPIGQVIDYKWNLYQFNSNNIDDWGNPDYWKSIYYTDNKFLGLFLTEDALFAYKRNAQLGDYAYVGLTLKDSILYRCNNNGNWTKTDETASNHLAFLVKGNITINSLGHWVVDGVDTNIDAKGPKGEPGKDGINVVAESKFSDTSINTVQNRVIHARFIEIENALFPVDAVISVSPTIAEYTNTNLSVTVNFNIKRRGELVVPTSLNITKDGTTIHNKVLSNGSVQTNVNKLGRTDFKLDCIVDGLNKVSNASLVMVLPMYFGFSTENNINDITSLTKQSIKTSPNGSYSMNNDTTGKYLWLCVPSQMNINKVTSAGFNFPIEAPITKNTTLGSYKCYRSSSQINQGNVNFIIQ